MKKKPAPLFLTAGELSKRWKGLVSEKTIVNWRYADPPRGPRPQKLGGSVVYPMREVLKYERSR